MYKVIEDEEIMIEGIEYVVVEDDGGMTQNNHCVRQI